MNDHNLNKIKLHFSNNSLVDVKAEIDRELSNLRHLIKPGASIALGVGSRGIKNLSLVVKEVAEFIKAHNAHPFIVPAMGSHGGATAKGQAEILAGYGINEESMGIQIKSSMEVVELPQGDSPVPVLMDRNAWESDGIILINRIKPHTDYHDKYESGLIKMSVIGLGKEKQATAIHRFGIYGLSVLIPKVAKQILSTGKILGGIAMVENAYDETMCISVLSSADFFDHEPILLELAFKNMPSLPFDDIDVLIIDRMGKDISGVGMDTNIIGRIKIAGQKEPDHPEIRSIAVLDLTDNSHGNAIGVGLADVITRRLFNKIDFHSTYTNAITSSFLERAKIPVVAGSDKEAFEVALRSCGYIKKGEEKIIRIKDTLHLDEIYVSQSLTDSMKGSEGIELISKKVRMFNNEDEINPF